MIPPDYEAVAVRLARLGRDDAYSLVQAAIAAKVPALDLLCSHLDATLARYKALPNCTNTPKVPAKAAQPAQAATTPIPAPIVTTPANVGHMEGPAKHGADDAAKRAALRAAMAGQPAAAPEPEQAAVAAPEGLPDTVIEPATSHQPPATTDAPIHQLPTVANGGQLYLDSVAALASLGYSKSEARRMAKVAVEHGAADVGAVIKACTRRA